MDCPIVTLGGQLLDAAGHAGASFSDVHSHASVYDHSRDGEVLSLRLAA